MQSRVHRTDHADRAAGAAAAGGDLPARFDYLLERLADVRRAEERARVATGAINALAGLVALVTLLGILEYLFRFDIPGRTTLFWSGLLLALLILGRTLLPPLGRLLGWLPRESDEGIARRLGEAIPTIGDRLLNTLQLRRVITAEDRGSGSLAGAAIASRLPALLEPDYSVIIERGDRRRSLLLLFSATITLLGIALLLGPELPAAWERVAHYTSFYQKPAPFTLRVAPGDLEIEPGESVEIVVTAAGIPPEEVAILLTDDRSERRVRMREETPGRYRLRLDDIYRRTDYRAEAAGIRSAGFTITVVERPEITALRLRLTPPPYSRLRSRSLSDGDLGITGLRGTQVSVTAETTIPVASAEIILTFPVTSAGGSLRRDTVRRPMSVQKGRLVGGFSLTRNGEYRIAATTADGKVGRSAAYGIVVTDDRSPRITLLQPTLGLDVDASNLVPVQVRITDDFGFSRLRISYRLVSSRYDEPWSTPRSVAIPIPTYGRTELEIPYLWDLTPERFSPEDEVEAWVEVFDNDPFLGPKSARSTRFLLRYPGFHDMLEESRTTRDAAAGDLSRLVDDADRARREMQRLTRELARQLAAGEGEAGWEEKRKMQDLIARHEQMQGRLQDVADELKSVAEKLRQADAISPETLREYRQLQELFEQIRNPELRTAMQRLAREMERMSPEEMVEAMKSLEFNEEEFRKAIERTRQTLERMKQKEEVDRLAATARHLAEEQQKLNSRMNGNLSPEERRRLAAEQRRLAAQSAELQQQAAANDALRRPADNLVRNDPAGRMERAAGEIDRGSDAARPDGERAADDLQRFAEEAARKRAEMDRNEGAARLQRMKKSLKELLDLAKEQEELQSRTAQTRSNSPELGEQARQQHRLKGALEDLADQIGSPEEPSFSVTPQMAKNLGDAMRQMADAQQALEGRKSSQAASSQGEAVSSMTEAAGDMAAQIEGAEGDEGEGGEGEGSGGSGSSAGSGEGSLRSRIQQLAAQQQLLNQAMGRQGEGGEGGEGSGQDGGSQGSGGSGGDGKGRNQQGMAGRIQGAQEQIRKSLDELKQEAAASGGRRTSLADDLEEAARGIEAVLDDLADGQVTAATRQRQDRILSRMLDALKSSRERDYDQKRESSPGSDVVRPSPATAPGIDPAEGDDTRLPGDESAQGYAPEYRELIRRYLESLE